MIWLQSRSFAAAPTRAELMSAVRRKQAQACNRQSEYSGRHLCCWRNRSVRAFGADPRSLSGFAPTGSSLFCVFLTRANNIGSEFQYFARLGARKTVALGPCRKLGLIQ